MGYESYTGFTSTIVLMLIVGALLSFSFNYALNYGMIITNPLFMRVVIIFGVPVSFVVNVLEKGFADFSYIRVIGAAFIVGGFFIFTFHSAQLEKKNRMRVEPLSF